MQHLDGTHERDSLPTDDITVRVRNSSPRDVEGELVLCRGGAGRYKNNTARQHHRQDDVYYQHSFEVTRAVGYHTCKIRSWNV